MPDDPSKLQLPALMDFTSLGVPGLSRSGGYITEEFLKELQGQRGKQLLREMSENDPIAGASQFAIEMLIRQADWKVDPGDETPDAETDAEFVESCLTDMRQSWEDTLADILTMLAMGFAPHEILYKRRLGPTQTDPLKYSRYDDGMIGWRAISLRAQETIMEWHFDDEGEVDWMCQMAPPDYKIRWIPMQRILLFRTTTKKGNPEGRSIHRSAYTSYYAKTHIQRAEAVGVERDLGGLPIAKVPPEVLAASASPGATNMRNMITKILTNVRRDEQEGILWPLVYDDAGNEVFKLELMTSGGARQFDTDKIIGRYEERQAMTTLTDFILLGHQAVGSKALSINKTDLFLDAISAWLDSIAEVFNTKAIPRLLALNGHDLKVLPKLAHGRIKSVNLEGLATFIGTLAKSGMPLFPDETLEGYLRQQADLPDPEKKTAKSIIPALQPQQKKPPTPPTTIIVPPTAPGAPSVPDATNPMNPPPP